jgi:hypothetical protein
MDVETRSRLCDTVDVLTLEGYVKNHVQGEGSVRILQIDVEEGCDGGCSFGCWRQGVGESWLSILSLKIVGWDLGKNSINMTWLRCWIRRISPVTLQDSSVYYGRLDALL